MATTNVFTVQILLFKVAKATQFLSQNIYRCQVRGLDLSYFADTVDTVSNLEKIKIVKLYL